MQHGKFVRFMCLFMALLMVLGLFVTLVWSIAMV